MNYRLLGTTGVRVSPLCLGTMMFGGATDEATSIRIIHKAIDQGINFIDTADMYAGGKSEEIVGEASRRQVGPSRAGDQGSASHGDWPERQRRKSLPHDASRRSQLAAAEVRAD